MSPSSNACARMAGRTESQKSACGRAASARRRLCDSPVEMTMFSTRIPVSCVKGRASACMNSSEKGV